MLTLGCSYLTKTTVVHDTFFTVRASLAYNVHTVCTVKYCKQLLSLNRSNTYTFKVLADYKVLMLDYNLNIYVIFKNHHQ